MSQVHWIWDPISFERVKQLLPAEAINAQASLSQEDYNRFVGAPPVVDRVHLLIELPWATGNTGGLALCRELLAKWPYESFPQLVLFSFLERRFLWERSSAHDRYVVKSLPYVQLPSLKLPSALVMSPAKWRYLRKYALTKSGILDKIIHDLRNAIRAGEAGAGHIPGLIVQLTGLPDLLGDELLAWLPSYPAGGPAYAQLSWASALSSKLEQRIYTLQPERRLERAQQDDRDKLRLMLVEDDQATADELTNLLRSDFEVTHFANGAEALQELKDGGVEYNAVICDLELLESGQPFDQPVQGIEVLEAAAAYPHLARRVITSMPRGGVQELLPEMRTRDVLYKAQLKYGADGLFMEFLDELVKETRSRRIMKRMIGPSNALWGDVSREKGASGGGFRSFYYRIKREHPETFKQMWVDIEEVADKVVHTPEEPQDIETTFGNREAAKTRMKNIDPEKNVGFLQMLLTHRMILLLRIRDSGEVVFTDADEPGRSYRHLPYWAKDKKPVAKAQDYCAFTGFEITGIHPLRHGADDRLVRFTLKYGQLFEEEARIMAKYEAVWKSRMDPFFASHRLLCERVNEVLAYVEQYGDASARRSYPAPLVNAMAADQSLVQQVLERLIREPRATGRGDWRYSAQELLEEFREGEEDEFVLTEYRPDYLALPANLRTLVDTCIDSLA